MLLGVWADQAGVFLAWLCAITTVVFAVPITFFPLRWARLMRWRIPAETQLTMYFGRCLGLFRAAKEALNKSTSDQRRANPPTPIRQWGFGE